MKMIAVTDDFDTCECCGRTGLKRTAVLADDEGNTIILGTTCAANKLGKGGSKKVELAELLSKKTDHRTHCLEQQAAGKSRTILMGWAFHAVKAQAKRLRIDLSQPELLQLARTYLRP